MKDLFWIITWLLLAIISIYSFTVNHENAHAEICNGFGGNSSITINYANLILGGTTGYTSCNLSIESPEMFYAYNIAQSNVEATYPLQTFILIAFFIIFLWAEYERESI